MTTLKVHLADAPTDVLVHLVDYGPCSEADVRQAVAPVGAVGAGVTVGHAIALLQEMGWVKGDYDRLPHAFDATDDGREAVQRARSAKAGA
jgi:hypothetical protein